MKQKRLALHWKILIGLVIGALLGGIVNSVGDLRIISFVATFIKPVGTLFIRLITMIAAPLVLCSLITGVSSVTETRTLGRISIKTLGFFLLSTCIAVGLGILIIDIVRPGNTLSLEVREQLLLRYGGQINIGREKASLMEMIVQLVPSNPFDALARGDMLQIVIFALLVGISLTLIPAQKSQPVISFFDGFTSVMIKIVDLVMRFAPYGVFALVFAVIAELGFQILGTLLWYAVAVIFGLVLLMGVVYVFILRLFGRKQLDIRKFYSELSSVQLLAFSSSSSAAALPLNMEVSQLKFGISERITSFVLPLGTTLNQNGSALFLGAASVFIAQVYGMTLAPAEQLTIFLTAVMASFATAAVPSAGIVMLAIVLVSVGIPAEGIALVMGIDRILDMCRTVVNVVGDTVVAVVIAVSENELITLNKSVEEDLHGIPYETVL